VLTAGQLAAIAPHCDAEILAPALSAAAAERSINTPLRLAHWLAQLVAESQGLTVFVENLDYTTRRLCQVWPGRFPDLAAAMPYAHNPEALANNVYGGRLGNTQPGDGWRFRGRGPIMITGRDNYARFGEIIHVDLIANPDRAGEPVVSPRIAAAFWTMHDLNVKADADDIVGITRAVNGGRTGLDDRKAALVKAKYVLGVL
jgi:putative chitinase